MPDTFVLLGDQPQREPDLRRWRAWMDTAARELARDVVEGVEVTTTFVGVDMSPMPGRREALVFETTVTPPVLLGGRYPSRAAAARGHAETVRQVRAHQRN